MRLVLLGALVLVLPAVSAGSAASPELVDAEGDVAIEAAPAPWQDSDLLAVWFDDGPDGLAVHVRIASVTGVEEAALHAQSDLIVATRWRVDHANASGRAARDGDWEARADYQATPAAGSWRYGFEGPCMDGKDSDGCAGGDRDIVDDLAGAVDAEANVVTVIVPWELLGFPQAGDGIDTIHATTQFVYPAYPAYAVDWDDDQRGSATYRYANPPGVAAVVAPVLDTSASQTSSQEAVRNQTRPGEPSETSGPADVGGDKRTPIPAWSLVGGLVLAALVRRQSR